ncbi:MAG: potassium channel family protein [Acidobacteria bacterium]|nr:potassium channel family protein [Acidobacteriota bacterium]
MTTLYTLAGVGLLLLIAYDVYATVLQASSRFGPIGETLNRTIWRATRAVAFRLSRMNRHKLLNAVGPLLLPLLIIIYIVLLIFAFSLIYFPRLPAQFNINPQTETSAWVEALYYSGVTLTTVGFGDITPRTTAMRLVTMFESASGLAIIPLSITYLLTAYNALERKRAIALSLYHQADEGADAASYIAHHFVEGRFYGFQEALRWAIRDLQRLFEAHYEHPVIHYFHPHEVYKGVPRMLFLLLESCAVIRTCLDVEEYSNIRNLPDVRTLEATARHVLHEMIASLDLERHRDQRSKESVEETQRLPDRYRATLKRLAEAGIKVRSDAAGWEEYRHQREDWGSELHRLASHLGYGWDETTGDRDLNYAANEEEEEQQSKGGG